MQTFIEVSVQLFLIPQFYLSLVKSFTIQSKTEMKNRERIVFISNTNYPYYHILRFKIPLKILTQRN